MKLGPKLAALLFLVIFIPLVLAELSGTNYKITSYVVDSGGSNVTSSNYGTDFTLGEIASAIAGTLYKLFLGFFYSILDTISPTVTVISPVNNSNFNVSTVNFNVSLNDIGSWCGLSINGSANLTMSASTNRTLFNYTNSSVADGSYRFIVSCNDTAGLYNDSGTYSFLVDTIHPNVSFVTPPTPANGSSQSATYIFVNVSAADSNNIPIFIDFDDSLVSWWRFDEVNGSNDPTDYMNRNNGTKQGNAKQIQAGYFGKGFSFDGDGDYVNISDSISLNSTNKFSLKFNFKPNENYDSNTDYISLVYHEDYEIYIDDGPMIFKYKNDKINSSTNSWNKGQWYHVAATYDGFTQTLYIEGLSEGNESVSKFILKNSNGENTASFFNSGNIILKGSCSAGSCSDPGDDAFIIRTSGDTVAYVNSTGDLCVEDSNCNDEDANCDSPGDDSFLVKRDGVIVSYINASGDLCLIGGLTENGSP